MEYAQWLQGLQPSNICYNFFPSFLIFRNLPLCIIYITTRIWLPVHRFRSVTNCCHQMILPLATSNRKSILHVHNGQTASRVVISVVINNKVVQTTQHIHKIHTSCEVRQLIISHSQSFSEWCKPCSNRLNTTTVIVQSKCWRFHGSWCTVADLYITPETDPKDYQSQFNA